MKTGNISKTLFTAALAGIVLLSVVSCGQSFPNLTKVSAVGDDLHGLAVKPDGDLYVATHHGLLLLKNDKDLYRIGKTENDMMGLSVNPGNAEHIYVSGHPSSGGNFGVMVSTDGGVTWKQIFRGLGSEVVDFHAMAISQAEPRLIYGWFQNKLYRTEDGGNNWKIASAKGLADVFLLATSPHQPGTVYASNNAGLSVSKDKGETWSALAPVGPVVGIAEDTQHEGVFYAYTQRFRMAKSTDGGKSWNPINDGLNLRSQEYILYIAIHPSNNNILYAGTNDTRIFKSSNQGQSWTKVR